MTFITVNIPTGTKDSKGKDTYTTKVLNTQRIWEIISSDNGSELNIHGHLVQVKESVNDLLEQINPATSQVK